MRGALFLLPVTNICKQFLIAKQKGVTELTLLPSRPVICQPEADAMVYRRRYDRWAEFHLIQIAARLQMDVGG